ncbi:hypothetical protein SAMN05216188_10754 [Lentzea xinjiangensis]|uniref:Nitroreductase family protein n=1 Tax=Lentzea xinjiangensis TaxID=402600 RepID=A0A1H9KNU9_9PSEU|nr:hypothetical protein SAMN05216188_10754 [Lentzea xinjiangensis]
MYSADRPWAVELHGRSVYLFEPGRRSGHDPLGFDRLLSCGAALEHVVLAVRHAGWHPHVVFPTDQASPHLLAVVRTDRRQAPDPQDLRLHRAIRLADASGGGDAHALGWANRWAGTELHALGGHELVVLTTGDRRPDHVRGGAALQAAVLAGRGAGVAVRPVVHLVHRREWRAGLIERHELAGFPQALAIVGAKGPAGTGPTAASSGRRDS